ncbi:MAG: transposase [Brevinematia bacterium]
MKYNPEIHHRRSIRLKGYDYSQPGAYFITLCVKNRENLFGTISNGQIQLNDYGKITQKYWLEIPSHFPDVSLDEFVIMPNHFHGIVIINEIEEKVGAYVGAIHELPQRKPQPLPQRNPKPELPQPFPQRKPQPSPNSQEDIQSPKIRRKMTIPKIVGRFKMNSAKEINLLRNTPGTSVWQRNYYEHIIRNEKELNNIRKYIINNPLHWEMDEYY